MMCFMFFVNLQNDLHVPPPLVPDHLFDSANLGTSFTGGLQAEYLFRFTTEQLHYLVDALHTDHRFDPVNLGTLFSGGLQTEYLFRFTAEQLHYLVHALHIPWIMRGHRKEINSMTSKVHVSC